MAMSSSLPGGCALCPSPILLALETQFVTHEELYCPWAGGAKLLGRHASLATWAYQALLNTLCTATLTAWQRGTPKAVGSQSEVCACWEGGQKTARLDVWGFRSPGDAMVCFNLGAVRLMVLAGGPLSTMTECWVVALLTFWVLSCLSYGCRDWSYVSLKPPCPSKTVEISAHQSLDAKCQQYMFLPCSMAIHPAVHTFHAAFSWCSTEILSSSNECLSIFLVSMGT